MEEQVVDGINLVEKLKEALNRVEEQFQSIEPFGGRLLLRYLSEDEKNKILGDSTDRFKKDKSGLYISQQEIKKNTKLDVGLIIKVGTVYNYYKGEFADYTTIFKPGGFVLFERVSWTPLNDEYCMVPIDSVHCIINNLTVGVDILNSTRRDDNY